MECTHEDFEVMCVVGTEETITIYHDLRKGNIKLGGVKCGNLRLLRNRAAGSVLFLL